MKTKHGSWAGALMLLASCGPPEKPAVTIGGILSVTGGLGSTGAEQVDAVRLAIEQINAAGGVLDGRPLAFVHRDDGTETTGGRAAAEALVAEQVPVVIGATGSAISLEVASILSAAQIVQLSASSTSPLLTSAPDNGGFLNRTCPSDASQGRLVSKRAREVHAFTRMAVVHIPGAYGAGLAGAFAADFEAGGGNVVSTTEYVEGQSSYKPILDAIYALDPAPQAILLVGYPVDGAQILNDYLQHYAASRPTFWFFTDALETDAFIAGVGAGRFTFAHEGTGPGTPVGSRWEAFRAAFSARYGRSPLVGEFSPNAYDAVFLAALAIDAAGAAEGNLVRARLTEVSSGGTGYGAEQFRAAADAAAGGGDIDYQGASGPVDLDFSGDVISPYDVWEVREGEIRIVQAAVLP